MNSKKFLVIFGSIALIILGCNAYINHKYDMYGVFDKEFGKYRPSYLNERFAKMDYLLHDGKGKYDTFIFGSSRVQKFNPKLFSDSAYNLGYSAGLPFDYLRDLKTLVASGIKIKKIYLAIDDFSYKRLPEEVSSNINFVGYSGFSDNLKYKTALLLRFPEKEQYKYMQNKLDVYKLKYNINIDGSVDAQGTDNDSDIDLKNYVIDERFKKPTVYSERNKRTQAVIKEIKEFKRICEINKIELIVFMNPTHIVTYLNDDINNLNEFKRELAKIVDFYDFSTINFITKNNYFWVETSHTRYFVSDIIIKRLLEPKNTIPHIKGFGIYLTSNNIDEYISEYSNDLAEYLHTQQDEQYLPLYTYRNRVNDK